jgi:signal transduction histidine kinase
VDTAGRRARLFGADDGEAAALTGALAAAGYDVVGDGAPTAVVVVGEDVPLVLAALRPESGQRAMLSRMEDLEAFAGRASHDLKTPLAVMGGTAQTLLRAWDRLPEEKRTMLLEAMAGQADKAAAMVNDLIALARTDPELRGQPVVDDVAAVVQEAVARVPLHEGDTVEVVGDLPPVVLPRADLLSIVSNLVDNAHHYGRAADDSLHVTIGLAQQPDGLRLTVSDTGAGVPEGAAEVLFRPDGRLPGSVERNPSSTGMGLAIVRRCAERAGGSVGVDAAAGGGACFWVLLPAS